MATGSKSARIRPADGEAFFTSAITPRPGPRSEGGAEVACRRHGRRRGVRGPPIDGASPGGGDLLVLGRDDAVEDVHGACLRAGAGVVQGERLRVGRAAGVEVGLEHHLRRHLVAALLALLVRQARRPTGRVRPARVVNRSS